MPPPEAISALSRRIDTLAATNESMPEAVRVDTNEKVRHLEIMRGALDRDQHEATLKDHGADAETVSRLYDELDRQSREFARELETLAQGAPTTIDVSADAGMRFVERLAHRAANAFRRRS